MVETIIKFCDTTLKFIQCAESLEQHKVRLRDAVILLNNAGTEIGRLNRLVKTYSDKVKEQEEK